jgi:hypothetical protein
MACVNIRRFIRRLFKRYYGAIFLPEIMPNTMPVALTRCTLVQGLDGIYNGKVET